MRDKQFNMLQDMYLFDPMTGRPLPNANPKLLELAQRKNRTDDILNKLNELYKSVEIIDGEITDTINKYINVSFENEIKNEDLEVILNLLAGNLEYKNRVPVKIFQNKHQIIVMVN